MRRWKSYSREGDGELKGGKLRKKGAEKKWFIQQAKKEKEDKHREEEDERKDKQDKGGKSVRGGWMEGGQAIGSKDCWADSMRKD